MKISHLRTKYKYLYIFMSIWLPLFFMIQGCSSTKTMWESTNEKKIEVVSNEPVSYRYKLEKINKPTPENPKIIYEIKQIPILPAEEKTLQREFIIKKEHDYRFLPLSAIFIAIAIGIEPKMVNEETGEEEISPAAIFFSIWTGLMGLACLYRFLYVTKESRTKGSEKYVTSKTGLTVKSEEELFSDNLKFIVTNENTGKAKGKTGKNCNLSIDFLKDLGLYEKEYSYLSTD